MWSSTLGAVTATITRPWHPSARARYHPGVSAYLLLALIFLWAPRSVEAAQPERLPSPLASQIHPLGYYSLPLDPASRKLATLGLLDGRPALLMFGSGFTFTTLDRSVAKYFDGLPNVADQLLDPFWGRISGSNWFVIRRLDLSRAQFTNLPVQFKDLSTGAKHIKNIYNGVLGADFLNRSRALICCDERRLLLRGQPSSAEEQRKLEEILRSAGYTEVTMDGTRLPTWMVPVRMNNVDFKMVVDTGSDITTLDKRKANAAKIQPAWGPNAMDLAGIDGHQGTFSRAIVKNFRIGEYEEREYRFLVGDMSPWSLQPTDSSPDSASASGEDPSCLLGLDYLRSRRAVIDFQAGKLWLHPPGK